ncbi:dynamin family protein [Paenalkalicoccus suaedae]|uniref:Dynamin family protein n=1 Tax=Paenalkalicoccus suaedae TaxID=2592382 RepID=A0A859FF06_9BACI|nr:dynamin family protein [Paenalkalicoccus suaedae]QKS71282.1 dynamin family protein [Paenalkalicoccus suaedae]
MSTKTFTLTAEEQNRLRKLTRKKEITEFEIAFCGHFSAGKSTILNAFLGAEVLPTSPLPTSANIIRMKNGPVKLELTGENGQELQSFTGTIPWDQVKDWGRDGATIDSITIDIPLPFLGEHGVIVDTPGVDSTDKNHAKMTTEQLFTTDAIVYVMDYNHVQSETNLHFLRELSKASKPIFIVINQIDKHDDAELSIEEFQAQVEATLEAWRIHYVELFMTSMREAHHPLNQYDAFSSRLKGILANSEAFLDGSYKRLQKGFYETLRDRISKDAENAREDIREKAEERGFDRESLEELQTLYEKEEKTRNYVEVLEEEYEDATERLYKNVHVFPYQTTELVKQYMESTASSFKVGMLFSKKKTLEEREKRRELLKIDVQDNIKSQLLYHLEAFFRTWPRHSLTNEARFDEALQELNMTLEDDFLDKHVKSGQKNNDYIYLLTKQVNDAIIREMKRLASRVVDIYIAGVKEPKQAELERINAQLANLAELKELRQAMDDIATYEQQQLEEVKEFNPKGTFDELREMWRKGYTYDDVSDATIFDSLTVSQAPEEVKEEKVRRAEKTFDEAEAAEWVEQIHALIPDIQAKAILEREADLITKAVDRFESRSFTISLFGAFSAGKSSFANALLGDNMMPVSPHPTTATVTIVQAPTDEYAHGTAVVRFKSRTALSEEITSVANSIRTSLTIDSIPKWNANEAGNSIRQKATIDYLRVIQTSLREREELIDATKLTTIDSLSDYVANEYVACFIEDVTIYYDAPLTRKGIILIDTPGVNSIHGRHTNLAFKQMAQSDAIFYLTYYNHSFSKSDQYFLQQVNQVNEEFSTDKLFFVVNASDLAASKHELTSVMDHVQDQLKQNGFKKPRVHQVSSKEGLKKKQGLESEDVSFERFEETFYEETYEELNLLGISVIKERVEQTLRTVSSYIDAQHVSVEEKAAFKNKQTIASNKLVEVEEISLRHVARDAKRELEQLSLYLRKRMSVVLYDYYADAINVSVLSDNDRKGLQMQLTKAIEDWSALGEQFLKQELAAMSVRLDYAVQRIFREWAESYEESLKEILPSLLFEHPSYQLQANIEADIPPFIEDATAYKSYIKSKRAFFEEDESSKLKDQLVSDALEKAVSVVAEAERELSKHVDARLKEMDQHVRHAFKDALTYEQHRYETLTDGSDADLLALYGKLKEAIKETK